MLYVYGPFGEVIRSTGPMAKANPIRFSTKYQDDESDLLYYGYRYYKASTGTWVSRDPKEERGGDNLYCFIRNSPENHIDRLGLDIDLGPGIPNTSNDRHNSYLQFHISCPAGFKVQNVTVDYDTDGMWSDM